ncbi:MAG TPA: nicotinate-nucleotide adenylyltransferase [Thermoanaerobaculia bacterium]|jgi:nicotinate-nucleotide adenylyltransferase|nr:nicotinate-nucleotide adenylyltransferase [Thermoanaerobaculia bacterium]
MKIGLFGGSFDPIHWGHIRPVLEAVEQVGLERVLYLPTGRPPHKPDRRLAPALARYAMTELALLEHDRLWVSSHELSEAAPTYTVDTVRHFAAAYPGDQLHLLIGADSFAELRTWVRFREILDLARLVVLARPGVETHAASSAMLSGEPGASSPRVRLVANTPVETSSTEVRRLLARGERPPTGWVPEPVIDFALKYRLYR